MFSFNLAKRHINMSDAIAPLKVFKCVRRLTPKPFFFNDGKCSGGTFKKFVLKRDISFTFFRVDFPAGQIDDDETRLKKQLVNDHYGPDKALTANYIFDGSVILSVERLFNHPQMKTLTLTSVKRNSSTYLLRERA